MRILHVHKFNIIVLLVSMFVLLYVTYTIVPYADNNGFFNENEIPRNKEVFKYAILCYPLLISYIVFVIQFFRKITFLMSLNYPIIFVNLYIGLFLGLLVMGGATLWQMVFTLIFALVALLIIFVYGVLKDYKYIKKCKEELKRYN